jgi:hypothetical protein
LSALIYVSLAGYDRGRPSHPIYTDIDMV